MRKKIKKLIGNFGGDNPPLFFFDTNNRE